VATSAANLIFNNTMNLGSSTRTITIGADGTYTLGIITNTGGLTVNATGRGILALVNSSLYSGKTTLNGGIVSGSGESMFGANPAPSWPTRSPSTAVRCARRVPSTSAAIAVSRSVRTAASLTPWAAPSRWPIR
jgi:hypothetical protein